MLYQTNYQTYYTKITKHIKPNQLPAGTPKILPGFWYSGAKTLWGQCMFYFVFGMFYVTPLIERMTS